MRFRMPWNSRKRSSEGNGLRVTVSIPVELQAIVRSYAERNNSSIEEAVIELARKGYDYWLLEQKYGDPDTRLGWDPVERYRVALHAFLDSKLRLREMYTDLQRLVLLLSSLVKELEDCNRMLSTMGGKPVVSWEELRLYREALEDYAEKYVNKVGVEAMDTSGIKEFVADCEKILERLKKSLEAGEGNGGSRV